VLSQFEIKKIHIWDILTHKRMGYIELHCWVFVLRCLWT